MATPENPHRILWTDSDNEALAAAKRLLKGTAWELVTSDSYEKALKQVGNGPFAVVVAGQPASGERGLEFLERVRALNPSVSRIVSAEQPTRAMVERAINEAAVFRIIEKPLDKSDVVKSLAEAVQHHVTSFDQKMLLREVSRQNKELEGLKQGLERMVADRTKSIKASKAEVERKQKRIRATIRFVKELALTAHLDDLFVLIRKELRVQRRVSDPILGYYSPEQKARLLFFRGSQVLEKQCANEPWPAIDQVKTNSQSVRKFLADQFGRPFGKVLSIPLKQRSSEKVTSVLFLEHGYSEDDLHDFLEYVMELLQPFSITLDRLLLAEDLRHTSVLWERTFDTIQDPVAIVNVDYDILRSNRHFSDRVTYGTCYKVFAGQESVCAGCPVGAALKAGKARRGEVRRGERIYQVHSYPILGSGEATATTVVNHYVDVTEARNLYSKAIQNEKMAALGVMAGHIAHELNNPLTGLRSLAQLLRKEVPAPVANDLAEVEKAAERSQRIIKNLLDFSQAGENSDAADTVSLNDIILKTLPMLKTAMRFHRSEIELTEDDNSIRVNPYMLQQVIFNLVNNACQAMENPGSIRITTSREEDRVCLYVRDTGPGIPESAMDRIFEPFFTTKPEGEGTGLGLSMSRQIIEKFGGAIQVTETGPQGTEFKVSLPAAKE
ncbi:MAG TPA: ATP-binding protein [Bdellovibrionales bacterium]|nr:ATP-binding protein [Bdellovibrionales bacterium]